MTSKVSYPARIRAGQGKKCCKYIVGVNGNKTIYNNVQLLISDMLMDTTSAGMCC